MKKTFPGSRYWLPLAILFVQSKALCQSLPLDSAVKTGKLSNGFTYYIRHNEEPKDRVVFYLANKVGALQEEENQRGLAHFLEHMSFNGTKHYPKNQLIEYLQKSGVRFGADLNAYTGFEETVYQLPLPANDSAIIRNGLQIIRDWAGDVLLETVEIDNERGVILEEKRLRNGAGQRLQDRSFPLQVNNSRFASRLPIGSEEVLKNFKPEALRQFYKDWYRPDQQALIIVGDIDVQEIERQVRQLFGDLKNPAHERAVIKYSIPLTGKNQFLSATDPELSSAEFSMIIKHPQVALRTRDDFRIQVMRTLFNQALSNRLFELTLRGDPPFIKADAGMSSFLGGLDAFSVNTSPKPGKFKEAVTAVWTEIIRLKQTGISATELERAKLSYLNGMENIYREKNKIPSDAYVQDYLAWFLHGTAAPGIEREYTIAKELLGSIGLGEVNAYARTVIKNVDRDLMVFGAENNKADLPDEKTLTSWLSQIEKQKLLPWKDAAGNQPLMPVLPHPGKIVAREWKDSIGVMVYTLSNQVRVWVKPTNFKNDEILFGATSEGGTSVYPDSMYLQASAAASVITANGVDVLGPVELDKVLTGKAVSVQPYIQERFEGITGSSNVRDLEQALQLTHLYFTKPRYDSAIFVNSINANRASIRNRYNSPDAVFNDTVNLVLSGHHFRRLPPSLAKLDSLDQRKILSIYRERFANAGDFTFVFTGSIDTASFLPLMERYIGSLPSTGNKEVARDLGVDVPTGTISRNVYEGRDNKAVVKLLYSGDYSFNVANNTQLSALGNILQYHITQRIRETEGGAYTPQAGINYAKLPRNRYFIYIDFTCAPQQVERLIAAVKDELGKLKTGGVSESDVEKFKAEQQRLREIQLQSNGFWQGWLTNVIQNDQSPTGVLKLRERLMAVTPESVQEAAQKFIDERNFIRMVLMPRE